MRLGDDDHAIRIATDQVAGAHAHVADVHGHAGGLHLHAILAGPHPAVPGVNRVAELEGQGRVAVDSVDQGAGNSLDVRDLGEDVAPHGRVLAPAVVQHDHAAGRNVVDVIAHRAG